MKVKRASPAWQKTWKTEKFYPPVLNEKYAKTNYLLQSKVIIVVVLKSVYSIYFFIFSNLLRKSNNLIFKII